MDGTQGGLQAVVLGTICFSCASSDLHEHLLEVVHYLTLKFNSW